MNLNHLNILLADDDIDDCDFFQQALDGLAQSTHFRAVNDGEQLMIHLTTEPNMLPDVLFLDLNMPRKNGFECLMEIKLNEKLKHFPVIMFSTSLDQQVLDRLYKDGARYFIRKPTEFTKFNIMIQHALTLITDENILQPTRENFVITMQAELINL